MNATLPRPETRTFQFQRRSALSKDRLQEQVERFLHEPEIPAPIVNLLATNLWISEVAEFRAEESSLLVSGKFEEAKLEHRMILADLISKGEKIVYMVSRFGVFPADQMTSLDNIKAKLQSLCDTFRFQHEDKNPPETDALIQSLFA